MTKTKIKRKRPSGRIDPVSGKEFDETYTFSGKWLYIVELLEKILEEVEK